MSDLSPIPLQKVKQQFQAYLNSPSNTTDINENYHTHDNNSLNTSPLKPSSTFSPVKYFSKNPSPLKEENNLNHISKYQNENISTANLFANKANDNASSSPVDSRDSIAEKLSPIKIHNKNHVDDKQMELNSEFDYLKSKGFSKKLTNSVISDLYQRVEKFSSKESLEDSNAKSINNDLNKSNDYHLSEKENQLNYQSIQPSSITSSTYENKIQSKFDNIYNKEFQRMESIETHYVAQRTKTLTNRDIKTPSSVIRSLASPNKNFAIESSKRTNVQHDISMMDVDETSTNSGSKKSNNKRQSVAMTDVSKFDPDSESSSSGSTTTKKRRTLVGPISVTIPLNDADSNNSNPKNDLKHLDLTVDMSMLTKFDDQQIQSDYDLSSSADISMTNFKKDDNESHSMSYNTNILDSLNTSNNLVNKKTISTTKLIPKQITGPPRSSGSSGSSSRNASNLIKTTKKSQISAQIKKAPKNNDIIMTDSGNSAVKTFGRAPSSASSVDTKQSLFSNENHRFTLNNSTNSRKFSDATTMSSISSFSHHSSYSSSSKGDHKSAEDEKVFLKPLSRPMFRPNSGLGAMKQFQGTQGTLKSQMRKQNSTSNLNSTDSNTQKFQIKPLTPRNVSMHNDDKNHNSDLKIPNFLKPTAASLSRQSSKNSISSTTSTSSLTRNKFNSSKKLSGSPSSSLATKEHKGNATTIKTSTSSNVAVLSTTASLNSISSNAKRGIQRTESGKLVSSSHSRVQIPEKKEIQANKEPVVKKKWGLYGNYFHK